ncbi:MAG TPA: efflux RND transporter periplasmic adaptor subunit [Vicinamibacterales bacterium]|jgi:RND family efflux transporter MFP subunit|nr:efflux RND transporter periplasmic adaptor subunit [Vicinamibacterales bacterium]
MIVSEERRKSRLGPTVGGLLLLGILLGLAFWGIGTRAKALAVVSRETREAAVPTVAIIAPERGAPRQEITLPGTLEAFTDAPIYARTNGYLRRRYVDIGAHVHPGQVLADIDTPEVDQQLEQARADLATAEANERLAQSTAERYRDLIKTDSVSKQDLDNANGSLEAKSTAVNSSKANVRRLEQLHGFGKITAPFEGVITARNIDVGALIDSGSNAKELFHEAAVNRLRLFVNVPEIYSRAAVAGMTADLTLSEFPGRTFAGTLARTAQAIDVASRTLLTEIDVENAKGELLPGSYAEVRLKVSTDKASFKLPVNAVMFRTEGVQVALVDANDRVTLHPITLGRDYGNAIEVVSGLTGSERIIVNPPDSIESGQTVRVGGASQP